MRATRAGEVPGLETACLPRPWAIADVAAIPVDQQRYQSIICDDENALTAAIVRLAGQYGRYGYRRVMALLHAEGWHVNHKRVGRIWRREGLKVPLKQPKRGRLWLNADRAFV